MDKLTLIRDWLVSQTWWPERKVITGALVGALTAAVVYFGLDAEDPLVVTGVSLAAAKIVEWLVPPSHKDAERRVRLEMRSARRRANRANGV